MVNNTNKDASTKSNGYIYQRWYGVLYFLDNETDKIIEEGKINGKTYEDITIYQKNGKKITYQIKHHKDTEGLGMSSEIYKVFSNSVNDEMDDIIYLVSESDKDTFTKELKKFNDSNPNEKYEIIKNKKDKDIEPTNKNYKNTIDLFENWGDEKTINYLKKFEFKVGYKYKELIKKIEEIIEKKLKKDDKIKITFIRYKIFELFTDNSFGENNMIGREKEYKKIFNENNKEYNKEYNKKYLIKTLLKSNYNDLEYLEEEIEILKLDENNIEQYLELLDYLQKMYKEKKYPNEEKLKDYYKKMCKKMCENAIIKINNTKKNIINENKSEILKSLIYYNNHSIENSININQSGIKCLFDMTKSTKSSDSIKSTKLPKKQIKNKSTVNK